MFNFTKTTTTIKTTTSQDGVETTTETVTSKPSDNDSFSEAFKDLMSSVGDISEKSSKLADSLQVEMTGEGTTSSYRQVVKIKGKTEAEAMELAEAYCKQGYEIISKKENMKENVWEIEAEVTTKR